MTERINNVREKEKKRKEKKKEQKKRTGKGWLIGSRPIRKRLAFWFSFSHAWARICSAAAEVKCGGIGLFWVSGTDDSRERLLRRHDFKYVRIRLRALSPNSGNWRRHESIMACTFSRGCREMGTMRSRFSSTNSRTNICKPIDIFVKKLDTSRSIKCDTILIEKRNTSLFFFLSSAFIKIIRQYKNQ